MGRVKGARILDADMMALAWDLSLMDLQPQQAASANCLRGVSTQEGASDAEALHANSRLCP
jgi:hypothetical protein